jgi:transcription initiation factor TFIIIB Brf1 subunit/transcription initiation factor TFIIB
MLNEVSKDFDVSRKKIIQTMSDLEYILSLTAVDYVDRFTKQLALPETVGEEAKNLLRNGNVLGTSPTTSRYCLLLLMFNLDSRSSILQLNSV